MRTSERLIKEHKLQTVAEVKEDTPLEGEFVSDKQTKEKFVIITAGGKLRMRSMLTGKYSDVAWSDADNLIVG